MALILYAVKIYEKYKLIIHYNNKVQNYILWVVMF